MFKWRLYYEDGSTFSDTDGEPWESPPYGVVGIGQPQATAARKVIIDGHAYLYRTDWDCWMEVENEVGERYQLSQRAHIINAVRYGTWMRRDGWIDEMMPRISAEVKAAQ